MPALDSRSWKFSIWKYKTRQNSYAQLYQYPFQSHTYEIQTHSYPMHCELAQVWCLQRSLDWFIFLGSFTYTSINSNPWNVVAKQCYTLLKRKKRMNNIHALSQKKKRMGRCVMLCTKPPWNISLSITCTWPMRWASRFLWDTWFDPAIWMYRYATSFT